MLSSMCSFFFSTFQNMNTHLFSLLLISLVFFSSLPSPSLAATSHRCHPDDYKSLMKIKKDLGNPYYLTNWQTNTDCCEWYSLHCDERTNRVYSLSLSNADLSGQIPSSVAGLPYLLSLTIRKNANITGTIPSSILKLKRLNMLWMDYNSLSGPIPNFIGQITTLDYINLAYNQFSGSVPASLSNLHLLGALFLSRNKLTGSIPESFGKFNSSTNFYFDLSHNQLSGPIPKSLSYVDFEKIDLSRNKLSGDGSVLFNPKRKTTYIDLSRNMLAFDLTNVRFPVTLNHLDLSHNMIRGRIPEQIKDVDLYGQGLNLSYNQLCGKIPSGGKFPKYDVTTYFHNKCLCGTPLPACKGKSDEWVKVPAN